MNQDKQKNKKRRKETQKMLFVKLSNAMEEYKSNLKEKKLVSNLKKVSKLFAADIIKATANKNGKPKKATKETSLANSGYDHQLEPTA